MRLAGTCCTTLLILLLLAVPGRAEDDGPLAEIILDCSLAMKAGDPELDSRMEMAWQALAAHYQRIAEDPNGLLRPPALRLAGGSSRKDNPWQPGQLVNDGSTGTTPFLPGNPLPPAPEAGGLLPLSAALSAAMDDLDHRSNQSQGFILLIAAGWEGGSGNPHHLGRDSRDGRGTPVIHVIGLAPLPAESRQLHQLAARTGGIYREVGGPAGLAQALHILAGSGGLRITAWSKSRVAPPPGSRLRIADRRGWYQRDFDYLDWVQRGGQIWVPPGPYDLELTCSGHAAPFRAPSLSVDQGRLTRHRFMLPESGTVTVRFISPEETSRQDAAVFSILDEDGQPVYRQTDCDSCSLTLFPGTYTARVRPYPWAGEFGVLSRKFRIGEGEETRLDIQLPAEGLLVIEGEETGPRVIIEDRQGLKVMSGRAEDPLSLPEGRYRLQILNDDREVVKSKRFRIRAGRTSRLGPFRTE